MCGKSVFASKIKFHWMDEETDYPASMGGIRTPGTLVLASSDIIGRETKLLRWGFFNSAVYNARVERILVGSTWHAYEDNRIILPLKRFYEGQRWFTAADDSTLAVAGLFNDNDEVVMITCPAIDPVKDYHDRMPFILSTEQQARDFLFDKNLAALTAGANDVRLTPWSVKSLPQ